MYYSVKIYSRIGELIQGILTDGCSFMVSGLPSGTLCSEAILEDKPGHSRLGDKTRQALSFLLEAYTERVRPLFDPLDGVSIRLCSNIPAGKGLSSSSADVLSVLSVVNDYLKAGFTPEDLYRFAARVEPTDPCLSSGIVLFKQRMGITVARLTLPPLSLLYFDAAPARTVDTLGLPRNYPADAGCFFEGLLRRFMQSAAEGDCPGLLESITRSAVYNQSILPLPGFDDYYRLAADVQAGLMVAHSGTIIGLLTPPGQAASLRERLEGHIGLQEPAFVQLETCIPSSTNAYA